MKKGFSLLVLLALSFATMYSENSSAHVFQRNLQSSGGSPGKNLSSCFIDENYVGMAWNNELVDAKSELEMTPAFAKFEDLEGAILNLAGAPVVAQSPAEFHSLSPVGYYAIRGGQYLRLDESSGVHQQLKDFIDLNCTPAVSATSSICRLECECWGVYSSYAEPFHIRDVESWGYCPKAGTRKDLYQFHLKKAQQACRDAGRATSASKVLRGCQANF